MTPDLFLEALSPLAGSLGWQVRSFTRDEEFVALAPLDNDPSFEQVLWVFDAARATLRCLLVTRAAVPQDREAAILELCARINDGLAFGCAEYSFADRVVIFRDSADLRYGPLSEVLESTTARLLDLGTRYSSVVIDTVAGLAPADAVARAEARRGG